MSYLRRTVRCGDHHHPIGGPTMGRTTTTTTTTDAHDAFPTVAEYVAADIREKARIRSDVNAAMLAAIDDLDMDRATTARDALRSYVDATKSRTTTPSVDWDAVAFRAVASLRHAAYMIQSGQIRPSGAPDEWAFDVDRFGSESDAATDGTLSDDDMATRFATDSVAVRTRAAKRDLRAYLAEWVATATPGTYTDGQIASAIGAMTDGDYVPSSGAVGAAIRSESGVDGIDPIASDRARGIRAGGRVR